MERTLIKNLNLHIGKEVSISGSIQTRRDHGKLIFLDLRDRSGSTQAIVLPSHAQALEVAQTLRDEWVVRIEGVVHERPEKMRTEGENGGIELEVQDIFIYAQAAELPFESSADINIDTYLDYLPLTLRREKSRAIFTIQSEVVKAFRLFLDSEDFIEFQSPKLIGDDAEGGANVFTVPYFKEVTAHLGTSPQLYKQIMVGIFERVYAVGTVFRAEKHATTRHLNEYTSMDFEMGFIQDHKDIMEIETRLIKSIVEYLQHTSQKYFSFLGATLPSVPDEIPFMKLREAQELIFSQTGRDNRAEPDLEPQDERWLCEWSLREKGSDFIYITHYPVEKRPMYTFEDSEDPGYTKSFDLLFRGVEISTGGQRLHTYESIVNGIRKKGLDPDMFSFYLQAFKYGMPPHGGVGIGLERLTQKLLGLDTIKEAATFPRDINRIDILLHDTRTKHREQS